MDKPCSVQYLSEEKFFLSFLLLEMEHSERVVLIAQKTLMCDYESFSVYCACLPSPIHHQSGAASVQQKTSQKSKGVGDEPTPAEHLVSEEIRV